MNQPESSSICREINFAIKVYPHGAKNMIALALNQQDILRSHNVRAVVQFSRSQAEFVYFLDNKTFLVDLLGSREW